MATEGGASSGAAEDQQITFNVKASNDQKFVLTIPATTTIGDLKAKLSTSEYADIPVDRLRLIYSGRVLKDPDTLASTKIKDGHTIHMVKGAASNARQNPAAQSTSTGGSGAASAPSPASNVPTNIAAGTGNNPLAALTGARYAGFHGLPNANAFGADGGMGAPPSQDEMMRMLEDPNFMQQMNEMMNIPEVQRMMEESPMLRDQPLARQFLRDPNMRRLMFDPRMLRVQMEMRRALGGDGAGAGSFPAPGVTDTTPQQQQQGADAAGTTNQNASPAIPDNPFAALLGNPPAGGAQGYPFGGFFRPPPPMASRAPAGGTGSPLPATSPESGAAPNPNDQFQDLLPLVNALRAAQAGQGGAQPLSDPFGSLFGSNPTDNRPPEERYADQLRQLNDMGFYEFERNIEALRRSGGSVQGAVEYLLSGGGAS